MGTPPEEIRYLSVKDIARIARVDPTTARRWKRGVVPVPAGMLLLLSGDLGMFDRAWAGWRMHLGELVSPEEWRFTPGMVMATQLHEIQLAAWRTENRNLRAIIEYMQNGGMIKDEQPTPDAWPEFKAG